MAIYDLKSDIARKEKLDTYLLQKTTPKVLVVDPQDEADLVALMQSDDEVYDDYLSMVNELVLAKKRGIYNTELAKEHFLHLVHIAVMLSYEKDEKAQSFNRDTMEKVTNTLTTEFETYADAGDLDTNLPPEYKMATVAK